MASDVELLASGTRTTTTKTETNVQPREVDTEATGAGVDLGDNRSCSIELVASHDASYREATLEVAIETSEDNATRWREVARFDRFRAEPGATFRQRVSFTGDRYARVYYRIAKGASPDKGGVSFSVAGRAVGAAT